MDRRKASNMEIKFDRMTKHQAELMVHIMNFHKKNMDITEFGTWVQSLSYADKKMVESLLEWFRIELLDQDLDENNMFESEFILNRIRGVM